MESKSNNNLFKKVILNSFKWFYRIFVQHISNPRLANARWSFYLSMFFVFGTSSIVVKTGYYKGQALTNPITWKEFISRLPIILLLSICIGIVCATVGYFSFKQKDNWFVIKGSPPNQALKLTESALEQFNIASKDLVLNNLIGSVNSFSWVQNESWSRRNLAPVR